MAGLGCVEDTSQANGCLFNGDVVAGFQSDAPRAEKSYGAWEKKLREVIRLLMVAYRLARPVNLFEAYGPLSTGESNVLKQHHSQWSANLVHSLEDIYWGEQAEVDATSDELEGKHSMALRFAVHRSRVFTPWLAPVVALIAGIRDSNKLRPLQLHSLDTGYITHSRVGHKLVSKAAGGPPCTAAMCRTLKTSTTIFSYSRKQRKLREAALKGIGESNKLRRNWVPLVEDSSEEREVIMDSFMDKNQRVPTRDGSRLQS